MSETTVTEIKSLNGYPLADTKAREDIATLSEEMAGLSGSETTREVPVTYSITGKYVRADGTGFGNSGAYSVSDLIEVKKGETITFDSNVPDGSGVGVLSRWTQDGNTLVSVLVAGTTDVQTVTYTATATVEYLRVCKRSGSANTQVATVTIVGYTSAITSRVEAIEADMEVLKEKHAYYDCFPFMKIGVIGDSLASGATNYINSNNESKSADRPEYSWGKFISREHGVDVSLFSAGGTSTRSWLSGSFGLDAMQEAEPCDCYIIGLGVNDYYALGTDYLGTAADVTVGSENSNADTYYGNYSKIIAALIAKSPRCKIFCLTMPGNRGDVAAAYNAAIREIVALYDNVHLLDLANDEFYSGEQFTSTWNVQHSTAAGYKIIAQHMWEMMNTYIRENIADFLDVQWIIENHD